MQGKHTTAGRKVSTMTTTATAKPQRPPPLGTPSYSRTLPPPPELTIAVGGEFARLRFPKPGPPEARDWKRGKVTAFSPRSRSRMLQSFARVDARYLPESVTFITLTYHLEWPSEPSAWKRQVEEVERRVSRDHPESWLVWRLEFQARGAPHFHLMIFHDGQLDVPAITADWHQLAGRCCQWCDKYMVDVRPIETWEQVRRYVSKYSAKVDEAELPAGSGRYWGVKGRKNRIETLHSVRLADDEGFRIRRLFKRLIRAANGYYAPGGPRSGVWVRCSNQTAKRALDYASSALPQLPAEVVRWLIAADDGPDTLADGNGSSSRGDYHVGQTPPVVHSARNAKLPLFDRQDTQCAWSSRRA